MSSPEWNGVDASERTFYRRLLDLGAQREIEPLLDEALALIVDVTAATTAYLEVYDEDTVDNMFNEDQFAVVRYFSTEGLAPRDIHIRARVYFINSVTERLVANVGGCYIRAFEPTAADAPPFWNMKTMLQQSGHHP